MKQQLKNAWVNTRSFIYTGLTLGGVLVVFLGSVVILPIVIGLVVAVLVFYICKAAIYENEEDN
tara:strand:- start:538 stop:729 length:192 start_codon:yes stop_codon:yes gene_type:complete